MQIPHKGDRAVGGWTRHGNFTKKDCRTPLWETDQYKDRSKDILKSIRLIKEELSDSDSEALIEEV